MVIQNYFNFENSSFVLHFTLDQTGVLFLGHLVQIEPAKGTELFLGGVLLSVRKTYLMMGLIPRFLNQETR